MSTLIPLRLSVMMFLQFFIWGARYVTAPRFLGPLGFSGGDFGWTYSVGPIAGIISPFFLGMVADRFFATEKVLGLMHLLGAAAMFGAASLMQVDDPSPVYINIAFFGHMLCYYPTLSLTNSLALHTMTNPEQQFPMIRVFGTIGWIVAGIVLALFGWGSTIGMFQLTAAAGLLLGLYCFTLPHTPPPSKGKKATVKELIGADAWVLFSRPSFVVFLVSSFLICIPLAFYYQLAERCVAQGGLAFPPFKMTFGQMSEIIFMVLMPVFFVRLGVKWMLFVGMLAWVARYVLFALGAPDGVAWMLIVGVALHGICYDFFFVTGQIYTDKVANERIRGQAQGLLVLCTLGFGMLIGAQVAGRVENLYTPPETAQIQAEANAVGAAAAELNEELAELPPATLEKVDQAWQQYADPEQLTAVKMILQMRSEVSAGQASFNQQAVERIAEQRTQINQLAEQEGEAEDLDEEIEKLREQQVDSLKQLALEQAGQSLQGLTSDPDVLAALENKEQARRLNGYKDARLLEALQKMNWQMIWALPAAGAAVIMVLFSVVFRDDAVDSGKVPGDSGKAGLE